MLNKSLLNYVLQTLWIIALLLGTSIAVYLFIELYRNENFIKENSSLLAAFFILLSASIASASIMKSIEANKELKDRDIANEHKSQLMFMIHTCIQIKQRCNKATQIIPKRFNPRDEEYAEIKESINDSQELIRKLNEDRFFLFIMYEGYGYFHMLHKNINDLNNEINQKSGQWYHTGPQDIFLNSLDKINHNIVKLLEILETQIKEFDTIENNGKQGRLCTVTP